MLPRGEEDSIREVGTVQRKMHATKGDPTNGEESGTEFPATICEACMEAKANLPLPNDVNTSFIFNIGLSVEANVNSVANQD